MFYESVNKMWWETTKLFVTKQCMIKLQLTVATIKKVLLDERPVVRSTKTDVELY